MEEGTVDLEDDDELKNFLPAGFGKQTQEANVAAQIERTRRPRPESLKSQGALKQEGKSDDDDDDDDSDDDEDEDPEDDFPISHQMVLKTHDRPVTAIDVDPSGARMVTGSTDCTIKLHDFASMTPTTLRAFKSIDPTATKTSANTETHPIHHVEFNPLAPSQMLVVSATPQARIFSRDGELLTDFVKGDMYLRDMHNTKGHVSEITTGTWHPSNRNLCLTAGTDSTLRIWDVNMKRSQKEVLVFKSKAAGTAGRTRMTAVCWSSQLQGGPNLLVSAALDGSLIMWSGEGPYARPAGEIRDAHARDTWTSGIDISRDGRTVVTLGGDELVKLWDTRKFKQPISTAAHPSMSSQFPTASIRFSPDSSSILTGSPAGDLHILNPATLRAEVVTPVSPGSALVIVQWHERLKQVITGSANAEVHLLYDPKKSTRGAMMVMSKLPKRRHMDDDPNLTVDMAEGVAGDSIVNPGALPRHQGGPRHPTIGLTASGKSRDPRRPHIPATTPFAKSQPDEEHIRNHIPLSSMRDEDPREALLKYAEKAEKEPMFTNAWKKTQPKTIYAELSDNEEGPNKKKAKTS